MWDVLERKRWALPLALAVAVTLVYLPSLGGGYLNYDDPWLIQKNALYRDASFGTLSRFFFDWSHDTRMALGAEWLPLRDLSLWLDFRVVGDSPQALRAIQLGLYLLACLAFRGALRRCIRSPWVAEAAAWVFALHPVHAESVAWLAGHKDVLALAFVGAALWAYGSASRRVVWLAPVLLGLAHLSKSMTVSAVGLLLAQDLLARRRPRWDVVGVSVLVALAALAAHVSVGHSVAMTQAPHGGSRLATAAIMGGVWLRYVVLLALPSGLSVVHDVPPAAAVEGVVGWMVVLFWGALGLVWWRRKRDGWPLASWLWFVVPLAPVSQVVFPLQNVMADRYLFLSAMVPALIVAGALGQERISLAAVAAVAFGSLSALRAHTFSDSVRLFRDATDKTHESAIAPYQLASALEQAGDDSGAVDAYEEALRRERLSATPREEGRRATNNLARLLVHRGRLDRAEAVLRLGHERWPDDPKILLNLVRVVVKSGRGDEAKRLYDELSEKFPGYRGEDERGPGP